MNNIYGYIRVSTISQREDRQWAALEEFGIPHENVFVDKQSGKDFDRPAYNELMALLAAGDTLVVKSLDRLGRNYEEVLDQWRIITKKKEANVYIIDTPIIDTRQDRGLVGTLIADLMLAVFSCVAEMERTFNHQRTMEGLAAARARGVKFGRKPMKKPRGYEAVRARWTAKEISARKAAKILGVSCPTFLKWVKEQAHS